MKVPTGLAIAAICVASFAFAVPSAAPRARIAEPPVRIEVNARAIASFSPQQPELRRFGALDFRGGVELTSPHREFGGFSALKVMSDGERLVSVTDKGWWLTGRLVYDGTRLLGVADAQMAPMLGPDGGPLASYGWYDAESLAEDRGALYVGIERVHRIVRFEFGKYGVLARAQPIATPLALAKLPNNKGLEGLAVAPPNGPLAGALIAISERALDPAGNLRAFLIGGPRPGEFSIKRMDDFDVSDCALAPSGDLVLLERRVGWTSGLTIRLRRIPLAAISPGALVDGPVLMAADLGFQIDNMEGISIHRTSAGETVLTLISDDNFSMLQRTLLLQFTLVEE